MADIAIGTEDLRSLYDRYHGPDAVPDEVESGMSAIWALFRKQAVESRWVLGFSTLALFGLSWLFVFVAARIERMTRPADVGRPPMNVVMRNGEALGRHYLMLLMTSTAEIDPRAAMTALRPVNAPNGMLRGLGGSSFDGSSAAMEVAFWNHPFMILILALWAVGRGSLAVAGELDRGTMDIALSRPVPRWAYMATHIAVAVLGLLVLAAALVAGNQWSGRYNLVADPPGWGLLLRPAANYVVVGLALYAIALLLSSVNVVRWRPTLIASVVTLSMYIATIVAGLPSLEDWKWIENFSLFTGYDPVEAVVKAESLPRHAAILGGIAAGLMALAFFLFGRRDLPANS